jgi:hypothetical protein
MAAPAASDVWTSKPLDCLLVLLRARLYSSRQAKRLTAMTLLCAAVFADHRYSPIPGAASISLSAAIEFKYIGV